MTNLLDPGSSMSSTAPIVADHDASILPEPDTPLRLVTKFAFALVTILGGMVIGTGEMAGSLPTILIVFAVIGFVFVDWLKLFALPSVIAYAAMIFAAIYGVSDFIQVDTGTNRKMIAVAELLVIAQSILMLQSKNQRLFEQLFVFAILNCVVAAVFNDAFSYATWLIPLTLVSGVALCLLAADATVERSTGDETVGTSAAMASLNAISFRSCWVSLVAFFPAVLIFATIFFFGLPRTIRATHGGSAGTTMVGFSETLRLEQIGQMLQSDETTLRVRLSNSANGRPYRVIGDIYLRGKVLESYTPTEVGGRKGSTWISQTNESVNSTVLSPEVRPRRSRDEKFFDRVNVNVDCEAIRTPSLFAIAPFHRVPGSESTAQVLGQWTLTRSDAQGSSLLQRYPPVTYNFGTHAFVRGIQSEWLSYQSNAPIDRETGRQISGDLAIKDSAADLDYIESITEDPTPWVPSAGMIARQVVADLSDQSDGPVNDYRIAKALEEYFANSGRFEYTLNLSAKPRQGVDAIEQFLTTDRRGHCQYFASAMAMMLRTQNIPSRLVVGYRCDEFNDLGQYFIVRESHAHAWVEALIPKEAIPSGRTIYGQPPSSHYWLRLDPTPGGGGVPSPGGSQMLDMAKSLWDDYVVELSPDRQREALIETPALTPMTQSYRTWIDRLQSFAMKVNSGEVEGFGGGSFFSFPAAATAIALSLLTIVAIRFRLPQWLQRQWGSGGEVIADRPTVPFYAEALDLLALRGLRRRPGQTPNEFLKTLTESDGAVPLSDLTSAFYPMRYRPTDPAQADPQGTQRLSISAALERLRKIQEARA